MHLCFMLRLGEELKTPSPTPVPTIAPPQVIEPTPLDGVVQGMTEVKIDTTPPSQPPPPHVSTKLNSVCCDLRGFLRRKHRGLK